MKSQKIRQSFLDFFKGKQHKIVSSAPMVMKNDPSLMFTNAGMNQFKDCFLGNKKPEHSRVSDSQKCLRVSGKHNDLEEVGKDTYHHTMFEMLGNWSFGDYFKQEAIEWSWELLTDVLEINPEQLYVTVFEGSKKDGTPLDQEAYDHWKKIVPEDRILMGDKTDNFWEMGDQGPCGPASEIHIDIRPEEERKNNPGKGLVNQDHPLVVEIWNLVFIQFNRKANGSLIELPEKHVDTGMGFERLAMVLQGKKSNYDTDVFTPLIKEIESITGFTYGEKEETDIAIRVIADHIRAVSFSIADGQLPDNTGAGYVIRRILRRAIRYGFTFLNKEEPFIFKLVETLSVQMGDAFPELKKQEGLCKRVIQQEEKSFLNTLEQGLSLLETMINNATDEKLSGEKAFELYDTFGFPIDLTRLIASEQGFSIDEASFEKELKKQKDRSRNAAQKETTDWTVLVKDDEEEFIGYDQLKIPVQITQYRKIKPKKGKGFYELVFNTTPFYPEGGGQKGDTGYLKTADDKTFSIIDTKKENNLIVHYVKSLPPNPEQHFKAVVDFQNRFGASAHHTATHLLHQALRSILGEHIEQKGSLVSADYLRFDFSHFGKISGDELENIESFVNEKIEEGIDREENRHLPYKQAIADGAMALFGEKYGDVVRTIKFGGSHELCGGTHVSNTSKLWHFKILNETSVASGVRRIEAIAGEAAKNYMTEQDEVMEAIKKRLNNPKKTLPAVEKLIAGNKQLQEEIEKLQNERMAMVKSGLKARLSKQKGLAFLAEEVNLDAAAMKDLSFQLGGEIDPMVLLLASEQNGKVLLSLYISKELAAEKDLNAGKIIKDLCKKIQGGGGGQAFFATAGGRNAAGIPEAFKMMEKMIR
jgi:alanyl-tRNA synthetase